MSNLGSVATGLIRRQIGRHLTRLREAAGLSQIEAAKAIQLSRSTILRMEDGADGVKFRQSDVALILDTYGAGEDDRILLLALTQETQRQRPEHWWDNFRELPPWLNLFVMLEDSASEIREFEPELVPGLLQTPDYMRRLLSRPPNFLPVEQVRERVELRQDRQALLKRQSRPKVEYILSEAVVRRRPGNDAESRTQIEHMITATREGLVSLRILPFSTGMHAAMLASGFTLLTFPEGPTGKPLEPPLAFIETLTAALYIDQPSDVEAYESVWRELADDALSQEQSLELLAEALTSSTR